MAMGRLEMHQFYVAMRDELKQQCEREVEENGYAGYLVGRRDTLDSDKVECNFRVFANYHLKDRLVQKIITTDRIGEERDVYITFINAGHVALYAAYLRANPGIYGADSPFADELRAEQAEHHVTPMETALSEHQRVSVSLDDTLGLVFKLGDPWPVVSPFATKKEIEGLFTGIHTVDFFTTRVVQLNKQIKQEAMDVWAYHRAMREAEDALREDEVVEDES